MNQDIDHLTKLIQKLDLNISNKEVDVLDNLFHQMKISSNDDDIDELINMTTSLSIQDDNIQIKLNNDIVLVFRVYNCGLEQHTIFTPNWVS